MNLGLPELVVIFAFLAVGALIVGGIVFAVVKLANRGRR
jgi:hypothetical protein